MKKELSAEKKMDINKKVLELLEEYDIDKSNPIDVVKLAKKMGFSLYLQEMDNTEDGFILVNEQMETIPAFETNKIICVNSERSFVDRRFIVAHELAHYILNDKQEIYAHKESSTKNDKEEEEADFFAACLLMVAETFTEKFNSLKADGLDLGEIAKRLAMFFKVEEKSVYRRIIELGLKYS